MTVATGFDVDYYLDQVGADYYLTAAGEPPGIWAGKGAEALGLRGRVGGDKASAGVMRALFHYGTGPDGVPLASRQKAPKYQARAVYAQIEEAIARRIAALGRFATPEEKRAVRLQERARGRTATPYYDMTFSAEKSVSLMYAGLLAAARQTRDQGDERAAERFRADAGRVEAAREAGRDTEADTAEILAGMTAGELADLRVADAARREWAEAHAGEAAQARAAEAELRRRDQAERTAGAARDQQLRQEREAEFQARLSRMVAKAEARSAAPEPWKPAEAMADIDMEAEI